MSMDTLELDHIEHPSMAVEIDAFNAGSFVARNDKPGYWLVVAVAAGEAWVKKFGDEFTQNDIVDLSTLAEVAAPVRGAILRESE
jgi:hypothetical protein